MAYALSTPGLLQSGPSRGQFSLARVPPSPDLALVIDCHWEVRWSQPRGTSQQQKVLPNPSVNLATESGGSHVFGVSKAVAVRRLEGVGSAFATKFTPGGFSVLSGLSADRLATAPLSLAAVFAEPGRAWSLALTRATTAEQHASLVEAFVRPRLPKHSETLELIHRAMALLLRSGSAPTVTSVAHTLHVSPRTLQRLFRTHVGVSPKWVLRRYRLVTAADALETKPEQDLTRLGLELGYHDQAHFVRDFRAVIGETPGQYARNAMALAGGASADMSGEPALSASG